MHDRSNRSRGWRGRVASALVWTMALHPVLPGLALAAPEGAQVVNGDVTIETSGDTTVITASDLSIIQYTGFDIGVNETVQFIQPSQLAKVLNQIDSALPTNINGSLIANGQVYIVNPAGVYFGHGSVVDVAGFVASAGHISKEDFLAGVDRFTNVQGDVVNRGVINADTAALIGQHVANHGTIQANDGLIVLAAGDDVLIGERGDRLYLRIEGVLADTGGQPAVENTGLLDAGDGQVSLAAGDLFGMAIHHTGVTRASDIQIAGHGDGLVAVSGTLDASNTDAGGVGGSIEVTGEKVALLDAKLDASGNAGGGDVRVGGDVRGGGDLRTADRTYVNDGTSIRVDALESGDGGTAVVWGNQAAANYGSISGTGGAAGGDGGFVEISSTGLLLDEGSVDLSAAAGETGTLLYDPLDIEILGGTPDPPVQPYDPLDGSDLGDDPNELLGDTLLGYIMEGDVGNGAEPFVIYESEIENTDANIILQASNSITTPGTAADFGSADVTVIDGNSLTLESGGSVDLDAGLAWNTSGGGTIEIQGETNVSVGDLNAVGAAVTVTSNTGSVDTGAITSAGALASGDAGGAVTVTAATTISTGAIDSSGADAAGASDGAGGDGGAVAVTAGTDVFVAGVNASGGTGDGAGVGGAAAAVAGPAGPGVAIEGTNGFVLVGGPIDATGGSGGGGGAGAPITLMAGAGGIGLLAGATLAADAGGAGALGGVVTLDSGAAIAVNGAGPHIDTTEDVSLTAATSIGSGTPLRIAGGGTADSLLSIDAGGVVDVEVTEAGFGAIGITQREASANVDLTQAGGDVIDIVGAVDTSTIASVDTNTSGNGVDFAYSLTAGDAATLAVQTGTMTLGGDTVLQSEGNLQVGTAVGTAIDANGNALTLVADSNASGTGAILDGVAGSDAAVIEMGAGDLVLRAGSGIGAAGDAVTTANVANVGAETSTSGGIHLTNTLGGTLTVATLSNTTAALPLQTFDADGLDAPGDVVVTNEAGGITLNADVDGANVTLDAAGAIVDDGVVATTITTPGDVSLTGTTIGSGDPITIDGGGTADSLLTVDANGVVDIDVTNQGFDAIALTQSDVTADADIVQVSGAGDDVIDINGGADSTIVDVDTNTSGNGVDFAYSLTAGDGADLVVGNGAMTLGGDTVLQSEGNLQVGTAPVTAILANGNDLTLVADSDGNDVGIMFADFPPDPSIAYIDMGGGDLVVRASQIGFGAGDVLPIANAGNVGAEASAGGVFLANSGGTLTVANVTNTSDALPTDSFAANGLQAADDVFALNLAGGITLNADVNGANVTLDATGAIAEDAVAATTITTPGDVTLTGTDIGSGNPITIDGGGVADSLLTVDANGVVDIDVTNKGFDAIALTQSDVTADADIVQVSGAGNDVIDIVGGVDTSTIVEVDTNASGDGVDFAYSLTAGDAATLAVQTGTMTLGGDTVLQSEGNLQVGTAVGTAIDANGNALTLVADSNASGTGAILDGVAGSDAAVIEMGAGDLVLRAGSGIGAAGDAVTTANVANVGAETSTSGGIHLTNTLGGTLTVATLSNTTAALPLQTFDADGLDAPGDVVVTNEAGGITLNADVDGANVTLDAAGAIVDDGVVATTITTPGDVSLTGTTIGSGDPITIDGGGTADSLLTVDANGVVDIDVTNQGFDAIALTQSDVTADADIVQVSGAGDDVIDINGGADSTIVDVDTITSGNGVDFAYSLMAGDGSTLVVQNGAMTLGGDTALLSQGDLRVGTAVGTAIDANGNDLSLVADSNASGTGAIVDGVVGTDAAVIEMGAGDLVLLAGSGIGADGDAITTGNVGNVGAETSTSGGIHLTNTLGGTLTVATLSNTTAALPLQTFDADGLDAPGDVVVTNDAGGITLNADVDGANVTLDATGAIADDGLAATTITTPGDVTLIGTDIGSGNPITIDGGGTADSLLTVVANGVVGVDVTSQGFDAIALAQLDVTADADIVQVSGAGNDVIDINGAAGTSTIASVDTNTSGNGVDFAYSLTAGDAATLAVQTGAMTLGGDTVLQNQGNLEVGTAVGTAIDANGNALTLVADSNASGTGAILDGVGGSDAAVIEMGAGDLVLRAGSGIGAAGDAITTANAANLAAGTPAGSIFLENTQGGNVTVTDLTNTSAALPGETFQQVGISSSAEVALTNSAPGGNITIGTAAGENIAGQNVMLDAAGSISNGGGTIATTGGDVSLDAGGAVGDSGAPIDVENVDELDGSAGAGFYVLQQVDGDGVLTLNDITVAADVDIENQAGDIGVSGTVAGGSSVSLDSGNDDILQLPGGLINTPRLNLTGGQLGVLGGGLNDAIRVGNQGNDVALDTIVSGGDVAIESDTDGLIVTRDIDVPGSIQLDTPYTIAFQTENLSAGVDILLNTNILPGEIIDPTGTLAPGQGSPLATIYRDPEGDLQNEKHLTLSAGNDISVGAGQKFSVPGTFSLDAGADVVLADVSALALDIDATNATFLNRGPGQHFETTGALLADTQGDVVVNTFDFNATNVNGNLLFLATPNGAQGGAFGFQPARIFQLGGALQVSDFVGQRGVPDGLVLDRAAEAVANLGTSEAPPIPEEITMGGSLLRQLNEAARENRPVWGSEVVTVLTCSLYEGEDPDLVPEECREFVKQGGAQADPRFQTDPMVQARQLYQVLYQDVDPLLDALQDAADAYRQTAPAGEISGEAFRQFVERTPELDEANAYLQQLSTLFELLDEAMAGGGGGGVEELRSQLLDDITPAGMSPEELDAAIEATPAKPRTAGGATLAAADGLLALPR